MAPATLETSSTPSTRGQGRPSRLTDEATVVHLRYSPIISHSSQWLYDSFGDGLLRSDVHKLFDAGFTSGTTTAVLVEGTTTDHAMSAGFLVRVEDVAGNAAFCDPVALITRPLGRPNRVTFEHLPHSNYLIEIANGDPGIRVLKITVNGKRLTVTGLAPNSLQVLDVSAMMISGNYNTVLLEALDSPGGQAVVRIRGS